MELDRARAAGVTQIGASYTTLGDEPLIVDLTPTPTQLNHWIVEQVSFLSTLSTRFPTASGNAPLTGLFLCPPATPIEKQSDLAPPPPGAGWNMQARGFQLPLAEPFLDHGIIGAGPAYVLGMCAQVGFKFTVPFGWFIRAIVVAQAGNAAPGPGIGSVGRLWVMAYQELDRC